MIWKMKTSKSCSLLLLLFLIIISLSISFLFTFFKTLLFNNSIIISSPFFILIIDKLVPVILFI